MIIGTTWTSPKKKQNKKNLPKYLRPETLGKTNEMCFIKRLISISNAKKIGMITIFLYLDYVVLCSLL